VKISHIETLINRGYFPDSEEWQQIRQQAINAVISVDWPPGSGLFTIYPESGKKRNEGNGVSPIKNNAISSLLQVGWQKEYSCSMGDSKKLGKIDVAYISKHGIIAFEWETGNISSSHRSLNKMALGLLTKGLIAGILVLPSRRLYRYLTDRIGNYEEIELYFPLWRSLPCNEGILEIFVIEQDAESVNVPRIPKRTDGRALV
jgi:hypothetical protein